MANFFGYISAFCTTAAFVPQAIKVFKTKKTNDISLGMILLMTIGVGFWVIYGSLINAWPIIIANVITFVLALYILVKKIKLG
ncbi:MAG: SemiSWEET transporter [Ignavibacteriaceae bacterium]|nr:SemiSWEET transporter [Ignavibacteriaceae bacterium]